MGELMTAHEVRILAWTAAALALVAIPAVASPSAGRPLARQAADCATAPVSDQRDPANPLALPTAPGADPLHGAHFFVDGPKHGQAAGEIARLLAHNPARYDGSYSWAQFKQDNATAIAGDSRASLLSKIADQQETQNISLFAEGGGPGAIFAQTHKILCDNMRADPTPATVPVLSTFFIYPNGQFCPSRRQLRLWQGTFRRDVNEMASAIGRRRAVVLEEIDSIGSSSCLFRKRLKMWLRALRYESKRFSQLPHAITYMEAGYSDAQGPRWTARRLWRAGIRYVEGFFTNDTHFVWSSDEIGWADKISDYLWKFSHHQYRARFIVNTAQNGQGPKRNPHPVRQGIESLCNPPGRGLGRIPTADTNPTFDGLNFPLLDAFLWTGAPGRSHNSNCPGGPWKPAGVFDPRFALELAQNANQQLGPGFNGQPY
jgi:hypothetical protein